MVIKHSLIGRSGDVDGELMFLRRSGERWCVRQLGRWIKPRRDKSSQAAPGAF
jgi:hypothetical protein